MYVLSKIDSTSTCSLAECSAMYVLSKMKDTVKIPPWQFTMAMNDAVVKTLNKKFANKVRLFLLNIVFQILVSLSKYSISASSNNSGPLSFCYLGSHLHDVIL